MRKKPLTRFPGCRDAGGSDGFTLLELLLVIGVMSIVTAVAVGSFDNIGRFFTRENVKSDTQKKARFGLEALIVDIQLAGLSPSGVAGGGIQLAAPTSIRVASDINFDGDFDDASETITYALNGTRLEQTNHLGTEALVENVSGFQLTYFDRNGVQLPQPVTLAEVRSVEVTVALTSPAGRGTSITRSYSTRIRCRNL
jgi:prepilin-type N-terminal cleavage/methylation domain-containing protein